MRKNVPCELIHRPFGLVFVPSLELPSSVLITVQHNGLAKEVFDDIYAPRESWAKADLRTLPLAMEIFKQGSPHVAVIYQQFPRKFVDTNVSRERAFADPRMEIYFQEFHNEISQRLARSAEKHGCETLLLDFHGFVNQPEYAPKPGGYDVIMGTANRCTVLYRRTKYDRRANIDYALRDSFQTRGLSVFCPEEEPIQEKVWREKREKESGISCVPNHQIIGENRREYLGLLTPCLSDRYDGGQLIRRYAKEQPTIGAAIQMEIAPMLRESAEGQTELGNRKCRGFIEAVVEVIKISARESIILKGLR